MPGLLATKLHRPPIPAKRIERPQLIHRLNEGLESGRQVALISAPAGFGKTTCIVEWTSTLTGCPIAWLSLDPSDDDPGRFFTYFVAALQQVDPGLGNEIASVLRSGQLPPAGIIVQVLSNDIQQLDSRFVLVLDDFQVIQDSSILQVIERLVANPLEPLHLVLITREDPPLPLARLRANNRLVEIRAGDLCFDSREAGLFLDRVMGLSLSAADITALEEKTEGWAAGLQLAGLFLQNRPDPSTLIAGLSGSHRFILSYLIEQVVQQQPRDIQEFLYQTAILDRFNGDLCDAVTGRSGSSLLLEQLYSANLFLVALDDERAGGSGADWYRYHRLFAGLLREIQNARYKEEVPGLHRRASRWFAQNGMVSEAVQHALAGEDYPGVVDLLESHAMGLIMQGYAKTVHGWIQALPQEWQARSPRTNLAFAWSLMLRGAYAQASAYLERLHDTSSGSPMANDDLSVRSEWLVLQSLKLYMLGEIIQCRELAGQALDCAPEGDNRVRGLAYYVKASVDWVQEDYEQAVAHFQKAIQLSRAAGSPVAEMMSTAGLAGMSLERGQLHLAFEIASQTVERIERSGSLNPISAVIYASLGDACYQWRRFEEARRHFERALHLGILGGSVTITIFSHLLLSRLALVVGDLDEAARQIQRAADMAPAEAPKYVLREVAAQEVRVYLALDRPAAAVAAFQRLGISFTEQPPYLSFTHQTTTLPDPSRQRLSSSHGILLNSVLRYILYQDRDTHPPSRLESALELASRLVDSAAQSQQHTILLEALLLRAQINAKLGESAASAADYQQAVALAEPEGFSAVFVEGGQPVFEALAALVRQNQPSQTTRGFIEHILAAFSALRPSSKKQPASEYPHAGLAEPLVEPLTERELEVLHLVADGLKYDEIAGQLYISKNTVRYHVKEIYSKLNVNNRAQAAATARRLNLL